MEGEISLMFILKIVPRISLFQYYYHRHLVIRTFAVIFETF